MRKPPPVLAGCRVLEYVVRPASITRQRRTLLFVNDKELGTVPGLVIGEDLNSGDIALFHCGRNWNVRGVTTGVLSELKADMERVYPGVSQFWRKGGVTRRQALAYLKRIWAGHECSFCQRLPPAFNRMINKKGVRICDICVREFGELFARS